MAAQLLLDRVTTSPEVTVAGRGRRDRMLVVWGVDRTLTRSDTLLPFFRAVVRPLTRASVLPSAAAEAAARLSGRAGSEEALLRGSLPGRRYEDVEQVTDGVLTGARSGASCRGAEKARRVARLVRSESPAPVWVHSGSRSDRPTLAMGDVSTLVRPFARLAEPRDPVTAGGPR